MGDREDSLGWHEEGSLFSEKCNPKKIPFLRSQLGAGGQGGADCSLGHIPPFHCS